MMDPAQQIMSGTAIPSISKVVIMKNLKSSLSTMAVLTILLAGCPFAMAQTLTPPQSVAQVKSTVEREKLVSDANCVDYHYVGRPFKGVDSVDVVEKHNTACGGDPGTAPRLFTVYVDINDHGMASDKDDPVDGTFKMLPGPDEAKQ